MAQVENALPSIAIKLVFCGPFGSGKTTNLHQLYARLGDRQKSRMLSLDPSDTTDEELIYHTEPIDAAHRPTLFFDLLPIVLQVAGARVVLRLIAGPGHLMHEHTRRLILRGAAGIVFVADSQRPPEENEQALASLRLNLRDNGLAPDTLPMVIQLNKRDLPEVATDTGAAQRLLGHRADIQVVPAVAKTGVGVVETLVRLLAVVWPSLLHENEVLARSDLDLPTLLTAVGRALGAAEIARVVTETVMAHADAPAAAIAPAACLAGDRLPLLAPGAVSGAASK